MATGETITVEIMGTRLQLRGGDDPESVRKSAQLVKHRVEELSKKAPTAPSVQLALLAAINIAYEQIQTSDDKQVMDEAVNKINQILSKTDQSGVVAD